MITETDFIELSDGTLAELVEDPTDPGRTALAVWKDGNVQYVDKLQVAHQTFVPFSRRNSVLRQTRLPNAVLPYGSEEELLSHLESLIAQCIGVESTYVSVLASFALSTWFVDRLTVAPYLSVVGLPQSGKTTLLRVLNLICRRPLLVADITSASFYRACAQFMPTMLIDEARTIRRGDTLRHMLRSGTTRDVLSVLGSSTFHAYGAKVISWLEPPDDPALNSRCVLIPMLETTRNDLRSPEDVEMEPLAATLQAQLLQFRFEHYRRVEMSPLLGDDVLRPRTRDLLRAFTAAHRQQGDRCELLLKFFMASPAVPAEPLSPEQNAVLYAFFVASHYIGEDRAVYIGDLTTLVNKTLGSMGEPLRLHPRRVGAVLTSLGFADRKRRNYGYEICIYREEAIRIHQIAEHYGIERGRISIIKELQEDCDLCQEVMMRRGGESLGSVGETATISL